MQKQITNSIHYSINPKYKYRDLSQHQFSVRPETPNRNVKEWDFIYATVQKSIRFGNSITWQPLEELNPIQLHLKEGLRQELFLFPEISWKGILSSFNDVPLGIEGLGSQI
ncbi:hypothetical protein CEXT_71601 [Caerostris extrusa]|uniref:Uncharacterized protein n=1 Tax=Caerostris extrusa TaxID=172846 RepID=A0AAV4XD92_CAEEX|nr:hypothetical protein CEXT_71601 [Caerostris extrusa]